MNLGESLNKEDIAELVKRLRERHDSLYNKSEIPSVMTEAASALESLAARLADSEAKREAAEKDAEQLRDALYRIAEFTNGYDDVAGFACKMARDAARKGDKS